MKRALLVMLAFTLVVSLVAFGAPKGDKAKTTAVSGTISDAMCGAKHAGDAAACTKKCVEKGSKLVLVPDKGDKIWTIDNADAVKGHEGHHVTVQGSTNADAGTIHVDKLEMTKAKAAAKKAS